ncbi:MAG TPA: alpha/beta hydrolase [Herpetosiphonaceae bacterium]
MTNPPAQTGYAAVSGLNMYYEIHGTGGQPLLLLHGAYMSIDAFGELLPRLAATRQVIAVELQGHGRTADVDRPIRYEQMADDVAALLGELGIESVDVFGYSMGGGVALQVAIRHPQLVRKLIAASAAYNTEGIYPELQAMFDTITPETFAGTVMESEYKRLAPNPDDFPTLVAKMTELDLQILDWPAEDIRSIKAPTMLILGDSDVVRPEHALEMFRLLGGGVCGDLSGLPNARLAVLPGTTHVAVIEQIDLLVAIILPFLDAPLPDATS